MNMHIKKSDLETYNRVRDLQSQGLKRLLIACYVILLSTFVIGISSYLLLAEPWPHTLLISTAALVSCLLILNYDNHSPPRCRFCHTPLTRVVRPLLLTQTYLSMEGKKSGDYFYTRRRQGLFKGYRWVKLSNQSLACNHCRLMEETYREVEELPGEEESRELNETVSPPAKTDQ